MRNNSKRLESVYALLCVFLPVLSIYASPVPGFDLGTTMVVFFLLICLMNNARVRIEPLLMILVLYTLITIVPVIIGRAETFSPFSSVLMRTLRFVLMLFTLLGVGYASFYSSSKYKVVLRFVSLFAAGYIYLQFFFFHLFGYKLRNVFGPIKGGGEFSSSLGEYEYVYRPPSFFLEPSHVCYFLIPFLCFVLFSKRVFSRRSFVEALFVTGGILLTTSGQGLVIVAFCWLIWALLQLKQLNLKSLFLILIPLLILISTIDISYTINRVFTSDELNAVDARSSGYSLVSEMSLPQLIIGNGFGNYPEEVYFASFADVLYCTGIIGLICVLTLFFSLFVRGNTFQRVFILVILTIMISGGIYTASFLCFYLPLLLERRVSVSE